MSKLSYWLLIFILIISPIVIGIVTSPLQEGDDGWDILVISILGVPLIAVCGIIGSFLFRSRKDAKKWAIVSYIVPAVVIGILLLSAL
jgi:hypothetical protein